MGEWVNDNKNKRRIRGNVGRRGAGGWARRRRGFILIIALVVILVGTALSVRMLVLTEGFSRVSLFQRPAYEHHIDITSEVKRLEAFLIQTNEDRYEGGGRVLHGQGYTSDDYGIPIDRLEDLQVTEHPDVLSTDRIEGHQRLVVQVYDANYRIADLTKDLLGRPSELKSFPPSLLPPSFSGTGSSSSPDGSTTDPSVSGGGGSGQVTISQEKIYGIYGAYLLRVQLYTRRDGSAPWRFQRGAEEGFFAVASSDIS